MSAWLNIIGVTEQGIAALDTTRQALITDAETVLGPQRFIDQLPPDTNHMVWQSPLTSMVTQVKELKGTPTVILATGDPNWFGIGATLARHLEADAYQLHPAPSSFQFAAARMQWPIQNIATISLHGREAETLHPHILPGNRILALTSASTSLSTVADILKQRGYGQSLLTVLENLGGADERTTKCTAQSALEQKIGDFFVLAIDCVAGREAPLLPTVPGLPDDAFVSDGQLTKREVRAATLAKLAPYPNALLWDVGAGCGSVGIEWMRATANSKAICFEQEPNRVEMITSNSVALGTPTLKTVIGPAPESFEGQAAPDAIFLGGDVANDTLFEACWRALKPGGRLVANAVTLEGEHALYARQKTFGGDLTRIDISILSNVGDYRALRPRMAVTQWLVIKGTDQ